MYAGYIALIIIPIIIAISGVTLFAVFKKSSINDIIIEILCIIFFLGIIAFSFSIIIVPCEVVSAKQEIAEFEATRDLCEQLIKDGDYNENIGLTGTIIEVNKWLMQTQARLKTWGYNSPYYGLGIENLKPITVRGDKR